LVEIKVLVKEGTALKLRKLASIWENLGHSRRSFSQCAGLLLEKALEEYP
jgi:hypothetical protein